MLSSFFCLSNPSILVRIPDFAVREWETVVLVVSAVLLDQPPVSTPHSLVTSWNAAWFLFLFFSSQEKKKPVEG